jgi:hypothetical protein
MFKRIVTIACALGLAGGLMPAASPSPAQALSLFYAHGTVYCGNGAHVTGVWVYSSRGGASGWAHLTPLGTDSAGYDYDLGLVDRGYWLAVGCGGTPQHWATTSYEEPSRALTPFFDYDVWCNANGSNGACYAAVIELES